MEVTSTQTITLAVLATTTGAASAIDLATRRIPNALSLATAAVGFGLAAAGVTGITLWSSILGCAIGLALMLPGHVLGATGAGDVKLFAGVGAVLGAGEIVRAFLFVAIAGGILALVVAYRRGRVSRTLARTASLCGRPVSARADIEAPGENNRFSYGPAIAAGCVLAALW